jgi:hypothetical protein
MQTARPAAWIVLVAMLAVHCAYEPVPLAAQAGTTILLPLTGEWLDGEFIGYESEVTRRSGLHDDQRGELLFTLREAAQPGGTERALVNRWVTRVYPDPASALAMNDGASSGQLGQVLALLDVPAGTPPGHYVIEVSRRRRLGGLGTSHETLPAGGPGLPPIEVLPAEIDPSSGQPIEKFTSYLPLVGGSATSPFVELYPQPKLVVRFDWPPAAARLSLRYPTAKVRILGVVEDLHSSSGSIVRWHDSDPPGELTIDLVDPDRTTRAIAVVFDLIAPFATGPADVSDFDVVSSRLYGDAGELLPLAAIPSAIR